MKATTLTHRYLAHFVVEADTPLSIGSGEKGFTVDRLIARDAMGLPYIPGSSLAGVLRNELDPLDQNQQVKELFGFQESYSDNGQGSRLVFSSGHLVGEDGTTIVEGLQVINLNSGYYSYFNRLPERDHVRMTHRGAADTKGHGKFDEELVHKGTRFAFRIEFMGDTNDQDVWNDLINLVHQPLFRIGAGTRKGFGKLKVVTCETRVFDLRQQPDLLAYLDFSSSLNAPRSGWKKENIKGQVSEDWTHYRLELKPQDFFLFAAGYGDQEVDNKPKTERYFTWDADKPELKEQEYLLIPATSVKGALSHRVSWHYNQLVGNYIFDITETAPFPQVSIDEVIDSLQLPFDIDNMDLPSDSPEWEERKRQIESLSLEDLLMNSKVWKDYEERMEEYERDFDSKDNPVGEFNEAVRALFGFATDTKGVEYGGQRGHIILDDVYLEPKKENEKIFSHVSIDRFTGGARDGMLFQQKVVTTDTFTLDIYVKKEALKDNQIKAAWEAALKDLCDGNLPLGGSTAKGHGIFQGKLQRLN